MKAGPEWWSLAGSFSDVGGGLQAHISPLPLLIGCLVRDPNLNQEVHSL
mgnify:CR=1 FL=1